MSIPVPLEGFGGGGGAGLNFKVMAVASEDALPDSAVENTIAVITETAINGYAIDANEPAAPVEGMVWISTGDSSPVAFNALKKNQIQVYPDGAKQYIGGAWANKAAYFYAAGAWTQFSYERLYLFKAGDKCTDVTGGWVAKNRYVKDTGNPRTPTLTFSGETMCIYLKKSSVNWENGTVQTGNKIDLSDYASLVFEVTAMTTAADYYDNSSHVNLGVTTNSSDSQYSFTAYKKITSKGTITIDISSITSPCLVAVNPSLVTGSDDSVSCTIKNIWLE